jgi:hypothetical protein
MASWAFPPAVYFPVLDQALLVLCSSGMGLCKCAVPERGCAHMCNCAAPE